MGTWPRLSCHCAFRVGALVIGSQWDPDREQEGKRFVVRSLHCTISDDAWLIAVSAPSIIARPGVRARAPRGTWHRSEPCNPYSGSTPPEAYSRPDRRTEQPSRAAAVQGWRAAPPEGLVLDWLEHDGSIGWLGPEAPPHPACRTASPIEPGSA